MDTLKEIADSFALELSILIDQVLICYVDVTNFIQLVSLQLVDRFSQTKLHCKAPNNSYLQYAGYTKVTTDY